MAYTYVRIYMYTRAGFAFLIIYIHENTHTSTHIAVLWNMEFKSIV